MLGTMKLAIAALALLNLVLLAAWSGLLEPLLGNGREPHRLLRQMRPERLRIAQVGWPARLAATQGASEAAASADAREPSPVDAALPAGAEAPHSAVGLVSPARPASSAPASPSAGAAAVSAGTASACIEWGTFSAAELPHARQVAERTGARTETVRRTPDPKAFIVYLPSAPDQPAAQARVDELRSAGIAAYVLSDGPYRWAVSLGVFRTEQSAQALRQALHDRGLTEAQVGVRGPERWALRLHSAAPLPSDRQEALSAGFGGRTLRPCSV